MMEPKRRSLEVDGARVDTAVWGDAAPEVILLHDGLGSIEQFRDLPRRLHATLGLTVLAYDRAGHGASEPTPSGPWPADWLHHEAERLGQLIDHLCVDAPLLIAHSDGGSIALVHAATRPAACRGVLALAAHSYVESVCVTQIESMRADAQRWVDGLSRFHASAGALFEAWSGVWVGSAFRQWDIRPTLGAISAPTIIAQGSEDEYATDEMATSTAAAIGTNGRAVLISGARHLVPQQRPDDVLALAALLCQ